VNPPQTSVVNHVLCMSLLVFLQCTNVWHNWVW